MQRVWKLLRATLGIFCSKIHCAQHERKRQACQFESYLWIRCFRCCHFACVIVSHYFHSLKPPKKHAIPPICNENTVCTPTILFASLLNVSDLIPPKNLLLIIYELMSMSKQYDFIFSSVGHKIIYIYINLFHKCIKNNMEREKYEGTCFYLSGADCSIEKVSTIKLEFFFFFLLKKTLSPSELLWVSPCCQTSTAYFVLSAVPLKKNEISDSQQVQKPLTNLLLVRR